MRLRLRWLRNAQLESASLRRLIQDLYALQLDRAAGAVLGWTCGRRPLRRQRLRRGRPLDLLGPACVLVGHLERHEPLRLLSVTEVSIIVRFGLLKIL